MSYVYGYDANTAALEMWHRNQEELYRQEMEQAGCIADSLRDSAKKMLLLAQQIEDGRSSLDIDKAGEHSDYIAESVAALWGNENA